MDSAFVGEIRLVGFSFAPVGWALCTDQDMPISQNMALFALLGTTYGGDGVKTFKLPHLPPPNPAVPSGTYIICLNGIFPPRD